MSRLYPRSHFHRLWNLFWPLGLLTRRVRRTNQCLQTPRDNRCRYLLGYLQNRRHRNRHRLRFVRRCLALWLLSIRNQNKICQFSYP